MNKASPSSEEVPRYSVEDVQRRHSAALAASGLANEADAAVLAAMGYKQELKRNFSVVEIFGIAFSIMGLLPSIASTLAYSIPAGPVGLVWGWFLASMFIFVVGLSMAELGSSMPTSGGLYYWTHYNSLGLIGGLCSIDYGFALQFLAVIVIARDGNWTPTNGEVYAVFLCTVLLHGVIASTCSKAMAKLQTFSSFMQFALILSTIIALPIGTKNHNNASFIFTKTANLTSWPTGWTFMLSWLSPIWTIGAFDSCVHMSEEASNAVRAVPLGITMSIGCCWVFGWVCVIVIAACINPDLESVLGSSFGQPMAHAVGKSGALGFMSFLMICQFLMGISITVAASRQSWAFSRDGALPFSKFFRKISVKLGYIPARTVWGCVFVAALMGLLALIDAAAAQAVFSLAVAGNNLAWGMPIFSRLVWGNERFHPGPFYLGAFSKPVGWLAILFLVFGIVLSMMPVGGPNPTAETMNYTVVINSAVWLGAIGYYAIDARKWFKGPVQTTNEDSSSQDGPDSASDSDLKPGSTNAGNSKI